MEASLVEHYTCVCFLAVSNINHRCLLSIFLSYGLIKQCANLRSTHFDVSKSEILIKSLSNVFIKDAQGYTCSRNTQYARNNQTKSMTKLSSLLAKGRSP